MSYGLNCKEILHIGMSTFERERKLPATIDLSYLQYLQFQGVLFNIYDLL